MRITTDFRTGEETLLVTKQERTRLHDAITVCRQFERHGSEPMKNYAILAMEALGGLIDLIHLAGVAKAGKPE